MDSGNAGGYLVDSAFFCAVLYAITDECCHSC